jgi:hypothetical protein
VIAVEGGADDERYRPGRHAADGAANFFGHGSGTGIDQHDGLIAGLHGYVGAGAVDEIDVALDFECADFWLRGQDAGEKERQNPEARGSRRSPARDTGG